MFPQINLNGEDGFALVRRYGEAIKKVDEAVETMVFLPHGRDYQTLPDGAYNLARDQMLQRIKPMIAARNYLEQIQTNILDQMK